VAPIVLTGRLNISGGAWLLLMNLFRSLQVLTGHTLVRLVHGLAMLAGQALLGVQSALAWLDGPHPVAARLQPLLALLSRTRAAWRSAWAVACWPSRAAPLPSPPWVPMRPICRWPT
jgi:hypothetical protein